MKLHKFIVVHPSIKKFTDWVLTKVLLHYFNFKTGFAEILRKLRLNLEECYFNLS